MSSSSDSAVMDVPRLSLLDKTFAFISWTVGGVVFLTVGWLAMRPDDPLGAVSLLSRSGAWGTVVQVVALACVASALATALAGRLLPDVGTFATAIGLAAVSLRGATAEALLVEHAEMSHRSLALEMGTESIVWLAVMLIAVGVSALVMRWCFGRPQESRDAMRGLDGASPGRPAAPDVPGIDDRIFGLSPGQRTVWVEGAKHAVITAGLGLAAISVLGAGMSSRSIQHGQACFVTAAGVCISCYFAHRIVPARSALWSVLGVGVIAVAAYLWAAIRPGEADLPASVPPSHFLRVLPVQYVAVGTAAAIAMLWYMPAPASGAGRRHSLHGRSPKRGGR